MRYRPRQVCLCDPNRLLSSLPRFSAHCHARSLLPTVVNHSTIYDENPDLHHGLLGQIDFGSVIATLITGNLPRDYKKEHEVHRLTSGFLPLAISDRSANWFAKGSGEFFVRESHENCCS